MATADVVNLQQKGACFDMGYCCEEGELAPSSDMGYCCEEGELAFLFDMGYCCKEGELAPCIFSPAPCCPIPPRAVCCRRSGRI